uniref:Prolyl 4-hydroxylase alpha subunit Fe(2+) 2OG dioxygenase domain-containing protein n=1 Tax=Pseudictyota dubia TaxID=2749911 RepID=A0A7R9WDI3_9STRA|mmetsp:Transcript_45777/g.85031  ORF Transcript_45777/g.85031 Transcript_45777/m.85031 type:complete len:427 (+) Transcript_45777:36-1316(+)|eukprot:CAMPEP_0197441108 /NCGR_PEP_ID=MMETSP1175-20131217/7459_1 /TAXON_ID=1003142 /ORGANISM="Triceratium dubium, Strain CCMP147" /LENGTH=426 /DNA_ID=CAMNT_0042971337 /DNA_START=21 /DNA_END=1301 /DNA_ORIENTATION=-
MKRVAIALVSTQLLPTPSRAFSAAATESKACGSDNGFAAATAKSDGLNLDVDRLRETIGSGRVHQERNFFTERQVQALLSEVDDLRSSGALQPSGLSNTNKGNNQNFGKADREVCPVPWWRESLSDGTRVPGKDLSPDEEERVAASTKLQDLRLSLSSLLKRPTMSDSSLTHECYYSRSTKGAFLDRHMDERHEETKGSRGWLLPSRRSISWSVYLSDPSWDAEVNGGQLRSFPQAKFNESAPGRLETGSHNGNLQVGWLMRQHGAGTVPVFLDSWFKAQSAYTGDIEPHCILYVVDKMKDSVEHITHPWVNDVIQGGTAADYIKMRALEEENQRDRKTESDGGLFITQEFARDFRLLEDRESWAAGNQPDGSIAEDTVPLRGSLVMFDSVSVPHEVLLVKAGTRTALAGWFHEETQRFPEDFYDS